MSLNDNLGQDRPIRLLRHGDIRKILADEIAAGKHLIGSRFSSEEELQIRFGVGRHTVREALRVLADEGYIGRRQRSGTVVLAHDAVPRYSQSVGSIQGLLDLGSDTRLVVSEFGYTQNWDKTLFDMLELEGSPRDWQRLAGMRERKGGEAPLCWSEIYIPKAFAIPRVRASTMEDPVFLLLMRSRRLRLEWVRQSIRAVTMPPGRAEMLRAPLDSPCLMQMLKFYTPDNMLFDASISLYPSDRYSFDADIRRQS